MNDKISNKDKKDWENFLKSEDKLIDKDYKEKNNKIYLTRSIDLHGYTLEEANKTIENFINKFFLEKVNKLIVVTGKGIHSNNEKNPYVSKDLSILKYSVPNYIKNNRNLMNKILKIDFDAVESSSKGSFEIILKKND